MEQENEGLEPQKKTLMIVSTVTYVENAPENYEHPSGVSLTVPDMSMSIMDIMTKYVQNNPIDSAETVFFDQEFPDIRMMSQTDLLEAAEQVKSELETIQKRIAEFDEIEQFEKEGQEKQKKKQDIENLQVETLQATKQLLEKIDKK